MKQIVIFFVIFYLFMTGISFAVPEIPSGLDVDSYTETSITVSWNENSDDETDGYYIYFNTTSSQSASGEKIITRNGVNTDSVTISDLDEDTLYYIWISAYHNGDPDDDEDNDEESSRSSAVSQRTSGEDTEPDKPTGFWISSVADITDTSVTLVWDKNSESDISGYKLYYGLSNSSSYILHNVDGKDTTRYTFTGLTSSERYYFYLKAVDENNNESEETDRIYVDTLDSGLTTDSNPPFTPEDLTVAISGPSGEVTVSFDGNNSDMVDLASYTITYWTMPGVDEINEDIGKQTTHEFTGLELGTLYYYTVTASDASGNTSTTDSVELTVENSITLLSNQEEFQGGCFISAMKNSVRYSKSIFFIYSALIFLSFLFFGQKIKRLIPAIILILVFSNISMAGNKNMIGIMGGYFNPDNMEIDNIYDETFIPVTLFYDRTLAKYVSADVGIGFIHDKAYAITSMSGTRTAIETELLLVPVSSSLNFNYEISPFIKAFVGGGLDIWYYREKTDFNEYDAFDDDKWGVGGYHGKAGLKLFTRDDMWFKRAGVIIESVYSKIDRFGGNELDLGGWTFNFGIFYTF